MSNSNPQTTTSSDAPVDGHGVDAEAPVAQHVDSTPTDVGNALNDVVHGLAGSADTAGGGSDAMVPAAVHSLGDLVASIASFDPSNLHGALEHLGPDAGLGGMLAGAVGNEAGAADALHGAGSVDLSDVGSLLSHAVGDVASSHLDLDHLTSNLNLFDTGHVDTGSDGGHHT
jgi:hypothetical protein